MSDEWEDRDSPAIEYWRREARRWEKAFHDETLISSKAYRDLDAALCHLHQLVEREVEHAHGGDECVSCNAIKATARRAALEEAATIAEECYEGHGWNGHYTNAAITIAAAIRARAKEAGDE